MKKRLLATLLALVMALGLCVTTAWAEEETVHELRQSDIDNGTYWYDYGSVGKMPYHLQAGSYRLMENITLAQNLQIAGNNIEIIIDLNGYTLSLQSGAKDSVLYVSDATLILTDSSAAQTGTVTGGTGYDYYWHDANLYGGGVCVRFGTFKMYGGTITNCSADQGGGVFVENSADFYMYGGVITACTATQGSAVYLENGEDRCAAMMANGGTVNGEVYVTNGSTVTGTVQGNVTVTEPEGSEGKTSYCTVTFHSNGGSAVASQTIFGTDAKATKPADPTREGHTFVGWLNEDGNDYDFGAVVTRNLELIAKWEEIPSKPVKPAPSGNNTSVEAETVASPKTGDAGALLSGALALTSLLGMGYVGKKR